MRSLKLFFTVSMVMLSGFAYSQWSLTGNGITPSQFLGTLNSEDLVFKTSNVERARIKNNGRFGYNISNPSTFFHIHSTTQDDGFAYFTNFLMTNPSTGTTTSDGMLFVARGSGTYIYGNEANFGIYGSNALTLGATITAPHLHIEHAGKIGINTTTPDYRLTIQQPYNEANALKIALDNTSLTTHRYSDIMFYDPDMGGTHRNWVIRSIGSQHSSPQKGTLEIWSPEYTNPEVAFIASGGPIKVGVGTTSMPGSHSFYVNGSILATEVWVKEFSAWPDYVFNDDYELMPLKELENYILANHHLPGIKSACEIEGDSEVSLNEQNRIQLEKIEELTLYVIKLKKELEALKEKVIQQ